MAGIADLNCDVLRGTDSSLLEFLITTLSGIS